METNFVTWYLENFNWLPTFYVNLEEDDKPDFLPYNVSQKNSKSGYYYGCLTGFLSFEYAYSNTYGNFFDSPIEIEWEDYDDDDDVDDRKKNYGI